MDIDKDYESTFRKAMRAAAEQFPDPTSEGFINAVVEAASEWASEYGSERYMDGCHDQSEAMSW